tara:strand:- start:2913 stop:3032 length:120 start_codon:yes stop_codon:yes gene_type:complete
MQDADMWKHFVIHAMIQIELARIKQQEEEKNNEPEETLH